EADVVIVPVGGGGLMGGVATAVKALRPSIRVVAVELEAGPGLAPALAAGKPVPVSRPSGTLADGMTPPFVGELPLEIARRAVARRVAFARATREILHPSAVTRGPAPPARISTGVPSWNSRRRRHAPLRFRPHAHVPGCRLGAGAGRGGPDRGPDHRRERRRHDRARADRVARELHGPGSGHGLQPRRERELGSASY